jgi:large subunit ribosomal protein L22
MSKVIYATAKYVRKTPRKTRLLIDLIRGKRATEAYDILKFSHQSAARDVIKVLKSAMANAEHNFSLDKTGIYVLEAFVNEAPMLKRGRAVSKGRYHQILKRNSHIVVGVGIKEGAIKPETKGVKAEAKKEAKPKEVKKAKINSNKAKK